MQSSFWAHHDPHTTWSCTQQSAGHHSALSGMVACYTKKGPPFFYSGGACGAQKQKVPFFFPLISSGKRPYSASGQAFFPMLTSALMAAPDCACGKTLSLRYGKNSLLNVDSCFPLVLYVLRRCLYIHSRAAKHSLLKPQTLMGGGGAGVLHAGFQAAFQLLQSSISAMVKPKIRSCFSSRSSKASAEEHIHGGSHHHHGSGQRMVRSAEQHRRHSVISVCTHGTTGADPAAPSWNHQYLALPHTSHLGATRHGHGSSHGDITVTAAPEHGQRLAWSQFSGRSHRCACITIREHRGTILVMHSASTQHAALQSSSWLGAVLYAAVGAAFPN